MKFLLFILISLQPVFGIAQKWLTLSEAEQQLQKNNLLLLAEQYNINASQAALIQAKIWELPYLTVDFNAINPQQGRVFDIGSKGQKSLAVEQLIYLGGKKKNEVEFAKSNVGIAELQFEQLLRNLKYQLSQNFYSLYFDTQKVASLDSQIGILDTLVNNYSVQAEKGNIPLKEVVRLQSLVFNLKNNKNELLKEIIDAQQTLSLLTGITEPIIAKANDTELVDNFQNKLVSKDQVMSLAIEKNLEYLTAIKASESQEVFLKWQKSLAKPDLTTGINYDQRSGAFQNQVNLTVGIPLAFWNRNKGNIKIAEAQYQQTNLNKDYKKLEIQTRAERSWAIWQQEKIQLENMDKSTKGNLELVYNGMVANFQKRNLSMLEFTDFMESYNQTSIQINEIKKDLVLSGISINYITNKEIF